MHGSGLQYLIATSALIQACIASVILLELSGSGLQCYIVNIPIDSAVDVIYVR